MGTDGTPVTMTVYIGVKGDANLDNIADAKDASAVLAYYADVQTGKKPEDSSISGNSDKALENLGAFLADVDMNENSADNFANEKTTANNKNGKRLVDAKDASTILNFYASKQTSTKDAYDIWKAILGDYIR